MISIKRDFFAYLDDITSITILLPFDYHEGASSSFMLENDGNRVELAIEAKVFLDDAVKYICRTGNELEFGRDYAIIDEHGGRTDLQIGAVIRTDAFDDKFYYDGDDLGVRYTPEQSTFKLWAPTATKASLILKKFDNGDADTIPLNRGGKGTWSTEVAGDLEGCRYSFLVCINLEWKEADDPYAIAVTANGHHGVIIDMTKTRTEKIELPAFEHPVDAVIYETHIRDLTIHPESGVTHKGTYLGAGEANTTGKDGEPTGLSYIKSLGVTHIEFLPFNDFEEVNELQKGAEYNWGYNPVHFNAPDGSYSLHPENPYERIRELKRMIASVHEQGMRVIMDVVYNHVYNREQSSFEKIVPGYFFRHGEDGMPSNGTGVGNDIATERAMVRKFIIDSIRFWIKEYHVDGFRFDLMGIFDVETMNQIRKAVDEIYPGALLLGEGWDLNTPLDPDKKANLHNQHHLPRIAQFNDWFRDSIKGSTFNIYDRGYALGNEHYYEAAKQVLAGSVGLEKKERGIFLEPSQSVNYVESHDNHTLWDKLMKCEEETPEPIRKKYHRLATAMVILAQGIPFLHSGQEFFRTKNGIGNSYRSPDSINQLDWERKITHKDNVKYIRNLIEIRKSHRAFRLPSTELIRRHVEFIPMPKPILGYLLKDVGDFGGWNTILVIFNPTLADVVVELGSGGGWQGLANHEKAAVHPFFSAEGSSLNAQSASVYILAR
ncbi:type I pullulanase [Bacillus sp. V3-13]|uniref:type I pullulanase n=1 Tax=Bacillus sp. V3-13 TaxID=2053728 RepID=UPI000C77486D|nr:type I pullulanase [Bacillus sp. V3-13]PLR79118.1 type I pullulanase [Bacillus sp. V3-13]